MESTSANTRVPLKSQDSGVGSSGGSESETSPSSCQAGTFPPLLPVLEKGEAGRLPVKATAVAYQASYLGCSLLDWRYKETMLPWVMAEIRIKASKSANTQQVNLPSCKMQVKMWQINLSEGEGTI